MKLFHLSDLHLGRKINSKRSLIEEQRHIITQIIGLVKTEKPDAVMIAGDVYDRAMPSEEAVELFYDFIYALHDLDTTVLIISGNHDSALRLESGGRILSKHKIHISPEFDGSITSVPLSDEHGEVVFYLMPFITTADVRAFYPEETFENCTQAIQFMIERMGVDTSKRNVLIAHQFIQGAVITEDSETHYVGTAENVDYSVFEPFDYVALGHLHKDQHIGRETVRYCGTPLKYTLKELEHTKSVTVLEIGEKGEAIVPRTIELVPCHPWRTIEGKFDDIIEQGSEDFVYILLTDEETVLDAGNKLRKVFPNYVDYDYKFRINSNSAEVSANLEAIRRASPEELFAEFFKTMNNGIAMSDEQAEIVNKIFADLAGGKDETDQT